MASLPLLLTLSLTLLLLHSHPIAAASTAASSASSRKHRHSPADVVRSSCLQARYPKLCLSTLASYTGPAKIQDIAQAAVRVSLARVRSVSDYLRTQVSAVQHRSRREQAALSDCVTQISESVDQLSRTLGELRHLKSGGESFQWQLSNAETWVSAALTNEDTCLDGFQGLDGEVKADVRRRITSVARVTSNALSLISRLN